MAMEMEMQRKRGLAAGNWAAMDTDILCSIFNRLSFVDLHRVKSICWGWHDAVDAFKSSSASSSFSEMPWLVFTPLEEDEVETCTQGEKTGRFVNIEESKIYPFNDLAVKKMNDGGCYCIGSSHDWLVCLDKQAIPYLLNPFTALRIDLPCLDLSLGVERIYGTASNCLIVPNYDYDIICRNLFVRRAVLSSSPSLDRNYCLVIIYGSDQHLGFCNYGDTSWSQLDCNRSDWYEDIVVHENQLYGLYMQLDFFSSHVKVWFMNQDGFLLVKKIDLGALIMTATTPPVNLSDYLNSKLYLVGNQGNLLVVNRFIERKLESGSFLEDARNDRTSKFHVYKLEADQKSFTVVTSLCGFALFLGKNQGMSVDARNCRIFKEDCIYFTDDDQGSVHDSGVFSLKDYSVDWLFGNKIENRKSGATWVVPPLVKLLN